MTSLLLLVTLLVGPETQISSAPPSFILKAGRVHLGTGVVLDHGMVHIAGGRIVAVGVGLDIPAGTEVIDLGSAEIMPGMVDGLSYAGLPRGENENEEGREHTASLRVSLGLDGTDDAFNRLRASGVTSLVVHPGGRNVTGGLVAHVKPVGGPDGMTVAKDAFALRVTLGDSPAAGHRSSGRGRGGAQRRSLLDRRPHSRMGTVFEVRQELLRAQNDRARRALDPSLPLDPDREVFLAVLDGRLPVLWMAQRAQDIHAALRIGEEFGIKRQVILEGHGADVCSDALAEAHVPVLLGSLFHPQYAGSGRGRRGFDDEGDAAAHDHDAGDHAHHDHDHGPEGQPLCLIGCMEDHEHRSCERPGHVHDENWPSCEGHDCCAMGVDLVVEPADSPQAAARRLWDTPVVHGFAKGSLEPGDTLLDYARFAVRDGLEPERALSLITSEPARILGLDDRVGSLAPGKDADLVVTDGDPLSPTSSVTLVIIDGRVVHDARKEQL